MKSEVTPKLSDLANPYDFAHPVDRLELFGGRAEELTEARYYLDQAQKANRPTGLAVIGERSSGKTSLLNIIGVEAKDRGFLVARVDLDEGDAQGQLNFFFKLFDSLATSAFTSGAFGGLRGRTYDTYLDLVNAYEIPDDKLHCPFLFPMQYAKAMKSQNENAQVSDASIRHDLDLVRTEVGSPIVVLMDECNVLTESRVLLEKLRNVFMNTPGYMLVLTGTPNLFPAMDEVFSPIIRQFKKIEVRPFEDRPDTSECIQKPLRSIGIVNSGEVMETETFEELIHDLSGGRPYEIQLVCHLMFRRVQREQATKMELTLEVLDEVRLELEKRQDVAARPVLNAVRGLGPKELEAMSTLLRASGRATFGQIWAVEFLFHGEENWTKAELERRLSHLTGARIIDQRDGILEFTGDEFDRIYCKYLARQRDVNFDVREWPATTLLAQELLDFVMEGALDGWLPVMQKETAKQRTDSGEERTVPALRPFPPRSRKHNYELAASEFNDESETADPLATEERAAKIVYWVAFDNQSADELPLATIELSTEWGDIYLSMSPSSDGPTPSLDKAETLKFREASKRATTLGAELKVTAESVSMVAMDQLLQKVDGSQNKRSREEIAHAHEAITAAEYLARDLEAAECHGTAADLYCGTVNSANNLGYIMLALGEYDVAAELFEEAIARSADDESVLLKGLPQFNLGVARLVKGNRGDAEKRFVEAKRIASELEYEERQVLCLMVPHISEDREAILVEEVLSPDLLDAAERALSALSALKK